ncbi:MAG TPA: ATP-binding protein [Methanomassiliicoccales archaeon]|jgi:signal transduction histidine kinase
MVILNDEPFWRNDPLIFLYLSLVVFVALIVIDLERAPEMMIGYFYIIPVVISYFTGKARLVYLVAALSTIASVFGLFFAAAGFASNIAINRPFSIVVVWIVAMLGNYQIRSNAHLAEERNRLRAILDTLPVGVAITDKKTQSDEANGQMDRIWGGQFTMDRDTKEPTSYKGYHIDSGLQLRPDEWPMARSVERGETVAGEVIDIERPDARRSTLLISSAPIKDDDGVITGAVSVAMDLTEHRAIEMELAKKNEDLFRSNRELQQFAYVASHDLKEPLRMVTTYVQLLDRRYGDKLDDQAREYIGFAVEGSKRMYSLVDDLLTYSRVETSVVPFGPVPMDQVLITTLKDLKDTIEATGAEISVDDLPEVHADFQQMVQLMENLIGNALKFRRGITPEVKVSASMNGREWVFSVKDNGIGMDMGYSDKVFQMFQRLHPRETFPGTGIGLAICKKVVERHGGKIWFESEQGVGTTFYFSLPANAN